PARRRRGTPGRRRMARRWRRPRWRPLPGCTRASPGLRPGSPQARPRRAHGLPGVRRGSSGDPLEPQDAFEAVVGLIACDHLGRLHTAVAVVARRSRTMSGTGPFSVVGVAPELRGGLAPRRILGVQTLQLLVQGGGLGRGQWLALRIL